MKEQTNWQFHENDVKTKLGKIHKELKELNNAIKAEFLQGWKQLRDLEKRT